MGNPISGRSSARCAFESRSASLHRFPTEVRVRERVCSYFQQKVAFTNTFWHYYGELRQRAFERAMRLCVAIRAFAQVFNKSACLRACLYIFPTESCFHEHALALLLGTLTASVRARDAPLSRDPRQPADPTRRRVDRVLNYSFRFTCLYHFNSG